MEDKSVLTNSYFHMSGKVEVMQLIVENWTAWCGVQHVERRKTVRHIKRAVPLIIGGDLKVMNIKVIIRGRKIKRDHGLKRAVERSPKRVCER